MSLLPNAGLPTLVEGKTVFPLGAEPFAEKMADFVKSAGLNIVGGCCGTTPDHIAALVKHIGEETPPAPSGKTVFPSTSVGSPALGSRLIPRSQFLPR
ncbi:MAG: homocysteine S-methyltransferase family protein [Planctomycetota bacterium]